MYYWNKIIRHNIYIFDSHDMDIDPIEGDKCFLIVHHVQKKSIIIETVKKLLDLGYRYFNIFGENAKEWTGIIENNSFEEMKIEIEASTVAREEMSYNLAMMSSMEPNKTNLVISDDEYFTEYLVEDLEKIFSGKSRYTTSDWQKFRSGFEFNYKGKDGIVSITDEVVIGYLGEEKFLTTIYDAFSKKIFDGKSFNDIYGVEI